MCIRDRSNGATLDEGDQNVVLPNEFIEQFKTGQAKEIDTAICAKTDGCNEMCIRDRSLRRATAWRSSIPVSSTVPAMKCIR